MLTLNDAKHELGKRRSFNAGNLTAVDNFGSYEVYSYGVLIAHSPSFVSNISKGVVLESAYTHSQTTSKHANIVKRAWGLI
jgi:hypothetical protein